MRLPGYQETDQRTADGKSACRLEQHATDCVFSHSVIKEPVQGWSTNQRPRATFLTVLPQRATSYTWAHMNITSLPHSHAILCSAINAQDTKHASTQCVCKSHPDFQMIQNFATYTRINTVFTSEPHDTGQRPACGPRAAGWPGLNQWEVTRRFCNFILSQQVKDRVLFINE